MRTTKELHSLLSIGLEPPDEEREVSPIPTDRALLLLAMDNPGIGFALGEIHNHFKRQLDAIPMNKPKRNPNRETFSFFVTRDFSDDEIEVVIEILGYTPEQQGGCHDERLAAFVELGNSFTLTDEYFPLTKLERETAAEQALKQIESEIEEARFQRDRD